MGFLDSLVKKVIRSTVGQEVNKLGDEINKTVKDNFGDIKVQKESQYHVSEKYLHFPQFSGIINSLNEKKTDNYERCTIDYKESTSEEIDKYIEKVQEEGYKKATNVRYEKSNEYIIIENDYNSLHLVFHIKF